MASSPQTYGTSFESFMQAAAIARATGTAVPGSAGSGPLSPAQPAVQEFFLMSSPRRTQLEEMGERIGQLLQAMSLWTAELDERMRASDARLAALGPGDLWARGRSGPTAAEPPALLGSTASATASEPTTWQGGGAAPLRRPHYKDVEKPKLYDGDGNAWLQRSKSFRRLVERDAKRWLLLLDQVERPAHRRRQGGPLAFDIQFWPHADEEVEDAIE